MNFNDIAEINPKTDVSHVDDDALVSFIPMSDVSDDGRWLGSDCRKMSSVRRGYTAFAHAPCERLAVGAVLRKLDRAIEQTDALLEKQQRIKTGLMHDLLARGLDAQGRLRDPSTHPFKNTALGSVPTDWDETIIGTL